MSIDSKERNRIYSKTWRDRNKIRSREIVKAYRDRVRLEVFTYYSGGKIACTTCGYENMDALCLDHVNDDGAAHRANTSGSKMGGINFYKYIRKHGYPEGLQLLCANCNMIKEKKRLREKSNVIDTP